MSLQDIYNIEDLELVQKDEFKLLELGIGAGKSRKAISWAIEKVHLENLKGIVVISDDYDSIYGSRMVTDYLKYGKYGEEEVLGISSTYLLNLIEFPIEDIELLLFLPNLDKRVLIIDGTSESNEFALNAIRGNGLKFKDILVTKTKGWD